MARLLTEAVGGYGRIKTSDRGAFGSLVGIARSYVSKQKQDVSSPE